MRILITGASGHLGSAVVRVARSAGHAPTALVRPSSRLDLIGTPLPPLILGDLADLSAALAAINSGTFDAIVHAAWAGITAADRNNPDLAALNLAATTSLADAAASARTPMVFVGSQAEYGPQQVDLTPDLPCTPITEYGKSKLAAGHYAAAALARTHTRFVHVRLIATYGPGDDPRHLIPMLIQTFRDRREPTLTPGEQTVDYLHVDDAADAITRLATSPTAAGIYVLASGIATPLRHLVQQIAALIDPTLPLGLGQVPYRPDQVMHLRGNISRLTNDTGWTPMTSLDQGLQRIIQPWPSDPRSL